MDDIKPQGSGLAYFPPVDESKKPKKPHAVADYKATADIVTCVCGTVGTAAEFGAHMAVYGSKKNKGTLDFLTELSKTRGSYFAQGSLTSYRGFE